VPKEFGASRSHLNGVRCLLSATEGIGERAFGARAGWSGTARRLIATSNCTDSFTKAHGTDTNLFHFRTFQATGMTFYADQEDGSVQGGPDIDSPS
jgi:hypothetical protein